MKGTDDKTAPKLGSTTHPTILSGIATFAPAFAKFNGLELYGITPQSKNEIFENTTIYSVPQLIEHFERGCRKN